MVALLRCCKPFLPPYLSPLSISKTALQFHSLIPKNTKNHVTTKRVRCICSTSSPMNGNSTTSWGDGDKQEFLEGQSKKDLFLYNTMSRRKELFKPKVAGKVGMYVCGVTAYDFSHIGHARAYVTFDVLYRYLKYLEYEVCYVRNFTDVDDKIIARANELGENPISLSKRFCEEFLQDMASLHCLPPSIEPRVSDHIPQIIDMIKQIIDNGFAYSVDGDVYFSVEGFPDYGRLSGRKLEDNRAGERVAVNSRKKNPADFALWKTLQDCEEILRQHDEASLKNSVPQDIASCIEKFYNDFVISMSDDLHTPVVLAALSDPLKTINDLLHTRKGKKRELRLESLAALEKSIRNVLIVLGLMPPSYSEVLLQLKEFALKRAKMSEAEVLQMMEERDTARKNKEYEKSDAIRKQLAAVGIALMDSPGGTTWRPVIPTALQQEPVPVEGSHQTNQ